MEKYISIREYLRNFDNGFYSSPDTNTQIGAGWYDWFCDSRSLRNKTIVLTKKLKRIVNSKKINQDTQFVWFKNNCPLYGYLYDDIRISDIETGKTIWCITPKSGHDCENGKGNVWSAETDKMVFEGTWSEIVKWFNQD